MNRKFEIYKDSGIYEEYLIYSEEDGYSILIAEMKHSDEVGVCYDTIELAHTKDEAIEIRDWLNKVIENWSEEEPQ